MRKQKWWLSNKLKVGKPGIQRMFLAGYNRDPKFTIRMFWCPVFKRCYHFKYRTQWFSLKVFLVLFWSGVWANIKKPEDSVRFSNVLASGISSGFRYCGVWKPDHLRNGLVCSVIGSPLFLNNGIVLTKEFYSSQMAVTSTYLLLFD